MNIKSIVAGIVITTAGLCGIGAGVAAADTPAATPTAHVAVGSPMLTQGFTFRNLSSHKIKYTQSFSLDGARLESGPTDATIIEPGGTAHWEQTYWFARDTHEYLCFEVMNGQGAGQTFRFQTDINGVDAPDATYIPDSATSIVGTTLDYQNMIVDNAA